MPVSLSDHFLGSPAYGFLRQSANSVIWLASAAPVAESCIFFGRPSFFGSRPRHNVVSAFARNATDPSGRPVYVLMRSRKSASVNSEELKYALQSSSVNVALSAPTSSQPGHATAAVRAAALDHGHCSAAATKPARSGFRST